MPIPNYETLMLPMLRYVASRGEASIRDITDHLAIEFRLTEAERAARIESGKSTVIRNRCGWARSYLVQAGILESVRRGIVRLSERGTQVLEAKPDQIDNRFLLQFHEFRDFRARSKAAGDGETRQLDDAASTGHGVDGAPVTPDDQITGAVGTIETTVRADLLQRILEAPPDFFERLVVDLLLAMGYGSSVEDAGEALGKTGDGGIDGIIREDRLGLDLIYIQAKRYRDQAISSDQIRSFSGALNDKGARKGVFITTSRFTFDAENFAKRQQNHRIVLIDGDRLTQLMLRHDVGVRPVRTIILKRVDLDYFDLSEET